jgi:hypothetical protein
VVLPKLNKRDLTEVPATARQELSLLLVETMDDVLARVLLPLRPAAKARPAIPAIPGRPARPSGRSGARSLRIARGREVRAR